MTFKQQPVVAGLCLVLVCIFACPSRNPKVTPPCPPEPGKEPNRIFYIHLYSDGSGCLADLSDITMWKVQQQKVTWVSDDDNEYKVNFQDGHNNPQPGTPFQNPDKTPRFLFDVKPHGQAASDVPVTLGHFYYSVTRNNDPSPCLAASDPGVYIK